MTLHLHWMPLATLAAGVLILIRPKLLNYVVAIWLIAVALIGPGGLIR
jgi:hypothetical protein